MNLSEKYFQDDRPTAIGQQSALECFNHETFKAVSSRACLRVSWHGYMHQPPPQTMYQETRVEWRESEDEYCHCRRIKNGSTHARVSSTGSSSKKQVNDASGGEK
ncbi:hypothetical protein PABG_04121 [Paracoccidioides brasiliensis Pb03]|uniref:Uncharacterized protein n=1 Tax=Paracoccidioides brasiliensis (strain Pb18) TaxID=502780 RepID=C1GBU5_PARBD|nr:uncharacterized protein PADG_04467 [Paracoccidioides brasiliensis Pb18]EEH21910.2 hypothetical protein PABG_04121 [Paracoccidioides brasiliensis Pb03]EEH48388.2 hypothetical protein PADG_04467 [Paracoccidioides brasiliensis Pb18]